AILNYQHIDVIFSTPPVVHMLAEELPEEKRHAIRGVHYGGVAMSYADYRLFHNAFPNAVHLSGYGNSLFGVFIEDSFDESGIAYCTDSERVEVQVVHQEGSQLEQCAIGEQGRVMMSRFDESFLILNMLERDTAVKTGNGIKNPTPLSKFKPVKVLY
ncbi:hypothetical protein KDK77_04420, partial [bacterium]|nr:hypothetical protein [bacterium]